MDAALGPVAHVASGDGPELVAESALDDEDQLVAYMAMTGKLGTRLDAVHERSALGRWILPEELPLDPGLEFFPGKIADGDDARHRLHGRHGRLLLWPSVSRPPVKCMPIFLFPDE
jgi:hypothetical protein